MAKVVVKEREVVQLMLNHLKHLGLYDAMVQLEQDTGLRTDNQASPEIDFLRDQVLKGSWDVVQSTLTLVGEQAGFNLDAALFFARRQAFLELIAPTGQPPPPKVVADALRVLSRMRSCSQDEINRLKLSVARMDPRMRFPAWTKINGRYQTFLSILDKAGFIRVFPPEIVHSSITDVSGTHIHHGNSSTVLESISSVPPQQLSNIIRLAVEHSIAADGSHENLTGRLNTTVGLTSPFFGARAAIQARRGGHTNETHAFGSIGGKHGGVNVTMEPLSSPPRRARHTVKTRKQTWELPFVQSPVQRAREPHHGRRYSRRTRRRHRSSSSSSSANRATVPDFDVPSQAQRHAWDSGRWPQRPHTATDGFAPDRVGSDTDPVVFTHARKATRRANATTHSGERHNAYSDADTLSVGSEFYRRSRSGDAEGRNYDDGGEAQSSAFVGLAERDTANRKQAVAFDVPLNTPRDADTRSLTNEQVSHTNRTRRAWRDERNSTSEQSLDDDDDDDDDDDGHTRGSESETSSSAAEFGQRDRNDDDDDDDDDDSQTRRGMSEASTSGAEEVERQAAFERRDDDRLGEEEEEVGDSARPLASAPPPPVRAAVPPNPSAKHTPQGVPESMPSQAATAPQGTETTVHIHHHIHSDHHVISEPSAFGTAANGNGNGKGDGSGGPNQSHVNLNHHGRSTHDDTRRNGKTSWANLDAGVFRGDDDNARRENNQTRAGTNRDASGGGGIHNDAVTNAGNNRSSDNNNNNHFMHEGDQRQHESELFASHDVGDNLAPRDDRSGRGNFGIHSDALQNKAGGRGNVADDDGSRRDAGSFTTAGPNRDNFAPDEHGNRDFGPGIQPNGLQIQAAGKGKGSVAHGGSGHSADTVANGPTSDSFAAANERRSMRAVSQGILGKASESHPGGESNGSHGGAGHNADSAMEATSSDSFARNDKSTRDLGLGSSHGAVLRSEGGGKGSSSVAHGGGNSQATHDDDALFTTTNGNLGDRCLPNGMFDDGITRGLQGDPLQRQSIDHKSAGAHSGGSGHDTGSVTNSGGDSFAPNVESTHVASQRSSGAASRTSNTNAKTNAAHDGSGHVADSHTNGNGGHNPVSNERPTRDPSQGSQGVANKRNPSHGGGGNSQAASDTFTNGNHGDRCVPNDTSNRGMSGGMQEDSVRTQSIERSTGAHNGDNGHDTGSVTSSGGRSASNDRNINAAAVSRGGHGDALNNHASDSMTDVAQGGGRGRHAADFPAAADGNDGSDFARKTSSANEHRNQNGYIDEESRNQGSDMMNRFARGSRGAGSAVAPQEQASSALMQQRASVVPDQRQMQHLARDGQSESIMRTDREAHPSVREHSSSVADAFDVRSSAANGSVRHATDATDASGRIAREKYMDGVDVGGDIMGRINSGLPANTQGQVTNDTSTRHNDARRRQSSSSSVPFETDGARDGDMAMRARGGGGDMAMPDQRDSVGRAVNRDVVGDGAPLSSNNHDPSQQQAQHKHAPATAIGDENVPHQRMQQSLGHARALQYDHAHQQQVLAAKTNDGPTAASSPSSFTSVLRAGGADSSADSHHAAAAAAALGSKHATPARHAVVGTGDTEPPHVPVNSDAFQWFKRFAPTCTLPSGHGPVRAAAFDPSGRVLALGSNARSILMHALDTTYSPRTASASRKDELGERLAIRATGRYLSSGTQARQAPQVRTSFTMEEAHHGSLYCLAWGSKVRASAAESTPGQSHGSANSNNNNNNTPTRHVRHRLVATGSNDRLVKLWRAAIPESTGNTTTTTTSQSNAGKAPPDAPGLVELRRFKGHPSTVRDVAFTRPSSGTPSLVSVGAGDFGVRVWDLATAGGGGGATGEANDDAHSLHLGHTDVVFACRVLQGAEERGRGTMMVSASDDRTLRVWDPRAPVACRVVRSDSAIHALAVSPVNTWTVATGHADGRCVVWDLMQGRELYSPHQHLGDCRSVDYSADGRWLLSGAFCGTVAVSDVDAFSQSCVAQYALADEKVLQARWHPSGTAFVTSSAESVVKLWTVQ